MFMYAQPAGRIIYRIRIITTTKCLTYDNMAYEIIVQMFLAPWLNMFMSCCC